ncbi:MAG: hypothetical protein ACE5H7_09790 [Acidiferrobacterales bacterium]
MTASATFKKWRKARNRLAWALLWPAATLVLVPLPVHAGSTSFERFFGRYNGMSTSVPEGEISKRELSITIKPYENGFSINAETRMHKPGGRVKRVQTSISFRPTRRKNIYSSAMRRDLFGHAVPLDPLKGDPFIWATVSGNRFTVYAVQITDDGAQDLQIDKRTLTPQGMELEFTRFLDAGPIRRVTGTLKKVGSVPLKAPSGEESLFEPES